MANQSLADHPGVQNVRQKSDPLTSHEQIEIDRSSFFAVPGRIREFREYAAGVQPRTLTEEQSAILSGLLEHDFSDNVCHQIVAEAAARLELIRFEVDNEPVKSFLTTLALRCGLDDLSGQTHYSALRDGDYCLTLGWDAAQGRVTLLQEPWWDGQNGVFVAYDAQGNALYATKEWDSLEGFRRRTVWYADRIERFAHDGGVWLPFALPGDDMGGEAPGWGWPAPWTKDGTPSGDPLHIPVVHFANVSRGNGQSGFTVYGTSELDGGVLGFQDQINDLQMDISSAARLTGAQMYFATGTPLPKDEKGDSVPFQVAPGSFVHSTNPEARFGPLVAGDMSQLINSYQAKLRAVSRMTRTPLHSITGGDWPSGEAILRSEVPAVNKARTQIKKLSPAWVEVAHRATEIANVFGKAGLDETAIISAVFAPPDQRDPLSLAAVAETIAPFVSSEEVLRLLGYNPAHVKQILSEKAANQKESLTNPPPATTAPDIHLQTSVPTQNG